MKLHILEQITNRLHREPHAPLPSGEEQESRRTRRDQVRARLTEFSEHLANIGHRGKGGPPRPH